MKNFKDIFKKLYDIFTPRERLQAILLFFAMIAMAFTQAIGVASILPFINLIMMPEMVEENQWLNMIYTNFNFEDFNSFVIFIGISMFLVILLSNIISIITIWAKTKFALGKNHTLSKKLLLVYLSKPYTYFLNRNTAEMSKNVLTEVNELTSKFLLPLFEMIIHSMTIISIIAVLLIANPIATLLAILVIGGIYGIINMLIKIRLKRNGFKRLKENKGRFKTTNEPLYGIKVTKVLNREDYFVSRYSKHSKIFAKLNIFQKVVSQIPKYILELVAFGGIIVFILTLLLTGNNVNKIIPLVSLFAFAGYRMMPSMQKIFSSITNIYYNQAILDRIYEDMINNESELQQLSNESEQSLRLKDSIHLNNIKYCYPKSNEQVIKGVNISIEKGTSVGFVGATGSGKTTLVDIILGLLTPQEGNLMIDGESIYAENIRAWQKNIGYVPQDIFLSDDTVSRNIAFGIPDNEIDIEKVKKASKIAALDEFIEENLPHGYDTIIGERGIRLSGGQRQRIGLARALYHNPEVLILDEATSSLDGKTENVVMKAIKGAAKDRTMIMIAHRLNTVKDCDVIYLIENGVVVKKGTYLELLKLSNKFKQMAGIPNYKNF